MTELQVDFSIKCDRCGRTAIASADIASRTQAREDFVDDGWRVIDNGNACPDCVEEANDK